ncbi:MAG: 3-isopropylmalate dehydratase small subunit [Pseudomonadota bacterium]|nr:3-isopropylmalate dehydratase small subunit [Pseudomonadota bacterium]URQ66984.1 3-isopropylmalate dehydratase small subunit [SAR86 cluster bacterium]
MKNTSTYHKGQAVPLNRDNIDTDQIIPKQFLKSIKKSGFGPNLFDAWRYEDEGFPGQDISNRKINKEFILNQEKFINSDILISKKNFGCGSSREHAVWSLMDFGFKVVIAESFADIFYNNCFNNGLLPIAVSEHEISTLLDLSNKRKEIEIDLQNQIIFVEDNEIAHFEIDPFRKKCILEGLDEIGLSLTHSSEIKEFERKHYLKSPWIFNREND